MGGAARMGATIARKVIGTAKSSAQLSGIARPSVKPSAVARNQGTQQPMAVPVK